LTRDAGENVGSYAILQGTLALSGNYDLSYVGANLTINEKAASVTPNAASKTYGEADPTLTGTLSGFLPGDGVSATYSRLPGEGVAGSPYTISATLSPGGVLGNYDITYNTANFTITARPITVTADAKSKVYGAGDPALTYQITSGSLVGGDSFSGSLTRDAGENVGSYAILQGTLALSGNYDLSYVGNNLTITKATPSFSDLTAPTICYRTGPTSLGDAIAAGSLYPSGNVRITSNGVSQSAPINSGTGTFSSSFSTYTYGAGSYNIAYDYAGDANFSSASGSSMLTVLASPKASITPHPAEAYAKVGLQFHGHPTGGSGTYTVHTWTGIGATYLSATNIENPIFTADARGSYRLTYTVTDSNGCVGHEDIVVQVINAMPVAQNQSLTTCKNVALAVTLTATRPQLDPLDPTLYPLRFAINSAPSDGTISGNLGAVTYTAPHTASVAVVYTAGLDFLGTATFTFIVTDPFGPFGIGTITVTVQECEQVGGGGDGVFADVVINEVAWGGTAASPQDEWIELRNNTDQSIDLTGWTLQWRRKQPTTPEEEQWKIVNLSGMIAPNGYYLLERRHDAAVSDVAANLIYDTTSPYPLELSDLGEVIDLVNAKGDVVDTANADHPERDGWIAGAGPDGVPPSGTMERIDPLSPDTDSNWATNRHLIINGLDASTDSLTATAVMGNENTLIRTLGGETPQVVQVGEQVTITVEFPLATGGAEGLPQVILAQMNAAAGGGGAPLEPSAQAAVLSSRRIGGTYQLSLDTSTLAPGTYGLLLSMGNAVFHGLVFEVVGD
jgi:hypothetical protein